MGTTMTLRLPALMYASRSLAASSGISSTSTAKCRCCSRRVIVHGKSSSATSRSAPPGRSRQRLFAAVDFGTLHGIRPMMHASAPESMIFIDGVEDVALNEEMLDRVRTGVRDDAFHRAITDAQVGRRRAVRIVALRNK